MKKKLVYSLVFILAVFLMVNYSYYVLSGDASSEQLTDSEKSLIKKFGYGGNYIKRWPDGIIYVYNDTLFKGLPRVIKEINQIIGGNTIFQLSNDKKISKVVFESDASTKYSVSSKWTWNGYILKKWVISIDHDYTHDDKLFFAKFTEIAGFNYKVDIKKYGKWWEFSIDKNIEKMLNALYKVPPGFNLLTGKVDETIKPSKKVVSLNTGTIKFTSTPSGAGVFLDGNFKGVSPITIKDLAPGKHSLKTTKIGYKEYQQEVTVTVSSLLTISSDKTSIIEAILSPLTATKEIDKPGEIFLSSTPSDAKIYLNNLYKGVTPVILDNLTSGTYQLKLALSGYQDYQQKVTVSSDKTTEVLAKLTVITPSYGKIEVTSVPSSAKVFLDAGQYMGKTPLTLNDISPGKHKVTLVLVDYEKYAKEVEVIAGKTIDLSTTLVSTKPKPPVVQ